MTSLYYWWYYFEEQLERLAALQLVEPSAESIWYWSSTQVQVDTNKNQVSGVTTRRCNEFSQTIYIYSKRSSTDLQDSFGENCPINVRSQPLQSLRMHCVFDLHCPCFRAQRSTHPLELRFQSAELDFSLCELRCS